MKKLIFLHIEKSAGSSQRDWFYKTLGSPNVFWYGIDSKNRSFNEKEVADTPFVGGHRKFNFYDRPDYGYIAILRNPIDRVISLYNFFIHHHGEIWKRKGLDASSFERTIFECEDFCKIIDNAQCEYISGQKDFKKTLTHIKKNKYCVTTMENMFDFNMFLSRKLEVNGTNLGRFNIGATGYRNSIDLGPRALKKLQEYTAEDQRLYNYLNNYKYSRISTLTEKDWGSIRHEFARSRPKKIFSLGLRDLQVSEKKASCLVFVKNISGEIQTTDSKLLLGAKFYDADDNVLFEARSTLNESIRVNEESAYILERDDQLCSRIRKVEIGVVNIETRKWIDDQVNSISILFGQF